MGPSNDPLNTSRLYVPAPVLALVHAFLEKHSAVRVTLYLGAIVDMARRERAGGGDEGRMCTSGKEEGRRQEGGESSERWRRKIRVPDVHTQVWNAYTQLYVCSVRTVY